MSERNGSDALDPVRDAIQTRHPRIADEIEGAISTLRKLRELTGPGAPDLSNVADPVGPPGVASILATNAVGMAGPATASLAGTEADLAGPHDVPDFAAGTSFSRYQIVRPLGRGAMGAVYLAYDTQLHRHVALKTPFLGNSRTTVERFYREARTAAQLRSPHLCPIHDVGQVGGVHYLSMAFIDGEPLTQAITGGKLRDLAVVTEVIRKIALGLQKAHEHGIIHRDLKPDNVMIDQDGEPVVMDFGLARRVDDETQITVAGKIHGTPAYMSPEQVEGDPTKVGPPSDIYSLGVVLYQILTGRMPFQGSLVSVLRQIGTTDPPRPSTINPELGADHRLEWICLKMMAKSPEGRFPSMAAVASAVAGQAADGAEPPEPTLWGRIWSRLRARRDRQAKRPAPPSERPPENPPPVPNRGSSHAPPAAAPGQSAPASPWQATEQMTIER
jgi:serine/threonine protein kinase